LDRLILLLGTLTFELTNTRAFDVSVLYRLETDFRATDSESLLSSQFLHQDSSLPGSTSSSPRPHANTAYDQSQAYGSLSSFHTLNGPTLSSSPLTTLRNAPYMGGTTPPPQPSPITHIRSPSQTSLSSRLRDAAPLPRRPSVTFMQPFKAPSLASSPSQHETVPPSPRIGSLRPQRPTSLKESFTATGGYLEEETPPASPVDAERKRYSSSFGALRERRESFHSGRGIDRRRFSGLSNLSKGAEDDPASVSSGSLKDEEEDVGLFLRMVEGRKELKSPTGGSAADLERFRGLRDGYGALGDSVSGSIYCPRSPPPPLAAIPRSVGSGESPHTPIIRSRLSEGVIVDEYQESKPRQTTHLHPEDHFETDTLSTGAKPVDIPSSPSMRPWGTSPHHHHQQLERLSRRDPAEQDHILDDDLESVPRHSSSLGSIEGIPTEPTRHRRKSSTDSARGVRNRPVMTRGTSGSRGTSRGSMLCLEGQGSISLRERFCSTFGGEEGEEGEELLFAMSDIKGERK
jgi:autophagy-related protein 13